MRLDQLTFDNSFTRELPADPSTEIRPRQVTDAAYSRVAPTPTEAPTLLSHSPEVLAMLDLGPEALDDTFTRVLSGNEVLDGMDPHAMAYAGHQFGNFAGQLGDGRAITLGEVVTSHHGRQTLQLKGAGPTPYSRTADGLAVLRSSIREFLCSEAMHHLGVPTTRALSLCLTGDKVMRDMFYDGRPALEPGAVVCRVAPSFIRFGNFELFAWRQETDNLRALADYTIRTHFPELGEPSPEVYGEWFTEIANRTADMVVHWQRVGFVHGVMNTDNMSIHGLTIDYGPYGWLEDYDPGWTPNTTDRQHRRYRFGAQPAICQWNLTQLANALHPLIGEVEPLQAGLEAYVTRFNDGWPRMMAGKLGLADFDPGSDGQLIESLVELLPRIETDMTIFFRGLADVPAGTSELSEDETLAPILDAFYVPDELTGDVRAAWLDWLGRYRARVRDDRREAMHRVNPKYVLRNYLAQLAIDASEQGDHTMIDDLLDTLRTPYDEQPGRESFAAKRPDWARTRAGCSMLSCSS
ncbi:MAG: YdiU family protein [Acidimicrobiales bacterium]|nr:YdiU family protein [Acidimicrobiales bacterium]